MIRRSEVRILSPLPCHIFIYISTLRWFLCLINRSLHFYIPRYNPHTFQFFSNDLLFQTQEVKTNPTWFCLRHSNPQQLLNEHSSKNYIFVELHEKGSDLKEYSTELNYHLIWNFWSRGWGTKQALTTIKDNPSLYLGEILANKIPMYRRADTLVGWGTMLPGGSISEYPVPASRSGLCRLTIQNT